MLENTKPEGNKKESLRDDFQDTFQHIMLELSPDGTITYLNQRASATTGYTSNDIEKGLHISQILLPEDREKFECDIESIIQGIIVPGIEYTILTKDETSVPVISYLDVVRQDDHIARIRGLLIPLKPEYFYESLIVRERRRSQHILDTTDNLIVNVSPDGKIRFLNRIGYDVLECIGNLIDTDWFETFVPEANRSEARETFAKIISGDTVPCKSICPEVVTGSGKIKLIDWDCYPLAPKQDEIIGVLLYGEDITERIHLENQLRESEEKYRSIFREAHDVIILIDADNGEIVDCNPEYERQTGRTRDQLIGLNIWELATLENKENAREHFFKQPLVGKEKLRESYIQRPDGTVISIEYTEDRLSIRGKQYVHCIGRDISERKRIENALEESEEKFSVAFHTNSSIMIINAIETGEYLEVNDRFCKATGYSRNELIGFRPDDMDVWVDQDEKQDMIRRMSKNGYVHDAEYRFRTKSGAIRTWLCSADLITIGGRQCALSVAIDITERKEAEAELELMYETESGLREQLEEEMKRRAEFTRALVHELKTPLTPIAASSEVLAMMVNGEPLKSIANNINRGAHNLNKRIDELLELARSELNVLRINPLPVDLLPLLRNIESEMASITCHHHQNLTVELPLTLGIVNADADRIRQVMENLLNNAFKYTPDGGEIYIQARVEDNNVIIDIRDTGPGLSVSEAERVFQPYYRKERDRDHLSGLGLGLALSKTLIDLHHGKMWVSTKPGEGSTFSFSLPLVHQ